MPREGPSGLIMKHFAILSAVCAIGFSAQAGQARAGGLAAIPTAGVSEAASWALMIMGFVGMGATLRSRRRLVATSPNQACPKGQPRPPSIRRGCFLGRRTAP